MVFTQWLLYNIPSVILCAVILVVSTILSIAGLLIVRRYVPHYRMKLHNDIAGPMSETLGVVYAVLLTFVVVITWQSFDKSAFNVEMEANYLTDLVRDSGALSESFKDEVHNLTDEYAKSVINDEWKSMARGESSPRVQEAVKKLEALYDNYLPKTETERIFFAESVRKLNELCELRRSRLIDAKTGVHPILWFVLIVGAVSTIIFTYFFGSENLKAHVMMTAIISIVLALILFTILSFDFPFTGDVSISPRAFSEMLKY